MTTAVTSSTLTSPVAAAASATASASSVPATQLAATQDRFLALLVAQMKNQDPLNPMDNAEVTSQMAQLSTVSGVNRLNSTVEALSASMGTAQSLQATSMIGSTVLVPGDRIVKTGGTSSAAVELSPAADKVTVTISDAKGNVVRTMQLGAQDAGVVDFEWDGKDDSGATLADGTYTYAASAVLGTATSTPTTLTYGMVNSISLASGGAKLNVDNLGDVALTTVRRIK
jgi:flagellar basal-body rod modification protein FlgD